MTDRVQLLKWESVDSGGSQEDFTPTELNPNEDVPEVRGIAFQNNASRDLLVVISRDDSGNMTFKDVVVGAAKTLTELLAGGTPFDTTKILTCSVTGSVIVGDDGNVLLEG